MARCHGRPCACSRGARARRSQSLYQEPRASPIEVDSFQRSLRHINLFYAHALTTVFLVTHTAPGAVPYHERGWTSFEYQPAWMIKQPDASNAWPQVLDLSHTEQPIYDRDTCEWLRGARRGPPVSAGAFEPGGECEHKIFTNGADGGLVAAKFRETFEDAFCTAFTLDFGSSVTGTTQTPRASGECSRCARGSRGSTWMPTHGSRSFHARYATFAR
jgi:hypothetical protein